MRVRGMATFIFNFLFHRGMSPVRIVGLCGALSTALPTATLAEDLPPGATYPVGLKQLEYVDLSQNSRPRLFA